MGYEFSLIWNSCDGGTIPKRHELIRVAKKKETKDLQSEIISKWYFCTLSNTPLAQPIVADQMGRLYNKLQIIQAIIDKNTTIKRTQLTTLTLTENPVNQDQEKMPTFLADAIMQSFSPLFICPITRKEMNGKNPFSYLGNCGCVFSDQALKEIPSSNCLSCAKAYTSDDIVPLNPSAEQTPRLADRMERINKNLQAEAILKKSKRKLKNDAFVESYPNYCSDPNYKKKVKIAKSLTDTESITAILIVEAAQKHELDKKHSEGISSLYTDKAAKKGGAVPEKSNWISAGTFNRYSSY